MAKLFEGIPRRRLVLHFDVNKTLIQIDPAGGKTLADVLNANIAARCYGTVEGGAWKPLHGPNDEPSDAAIANGGLMTYDRFVDNCVAPKPPHLGDLPKDQAEVLWGMVSQKRRSMKHGFTTKGGPGEQYAPFYDTLFTAMHSESGALYYCLPSFFEAVNELSTLGWAFDVVFRTFGTDAGDVLEEWERFLLGEHAVFKPRGPVLEATRRYIEAAKANGETWAPRGALFRDDSGTYAAWAATAVCPRSSEGLDAWKTAGLEHTRVTTTDLHELLCPADRKCPDTAVRTACLQDYYPWWAAHGEHFSAGKVFPIAPASEEFQVFFDDNVRFGENGRSIVDLRDVTTDAPVEDEAAQQRYLVDVDPFDAILNKDYFLSELAKRLRAQLE